MARYERPPIFSGQQEPQEMLMCYESAAQHNGWAADARLANLGLFLTGTAKKCLKHTRQPDTWADVAGGGRSDR